MNRKTVVVIVTALQLALLVFLLTWHVSGWSGKGWTGLGYSPKASAAVDRFNAYVPFGGTSRQVGVIAPRSPAARSDASDKDRVLSVNGIDTADLAALKSEDRALQNGDTVTYRVESDDGERDLVLQLESPFRSPYVVANLSVSVVVGLIWLVISLLVYWSRPRSQVAAVFFVLCSTGASLYFVWAVAELLVPNIRGILPISMDGPAIAVFGFLTLLSVLFANLLLHLSLIFPKRRPLVDRWPSVFRWLHSLPFLNIVFLPAVLVAALSGRRVFTLVAYEAVVVIAAVVIALQLVRAARSEGRWPAILARPWRTELLAILLLSQVGLVMRLFPGKTAILFGLLFAFTVVSVFIIWVTLYSVLTCVALYRSYRESGIEVQHQVRWPLWGTLTALGASFAILAFSLGLGYLASDLGATAFSLASAASVVSKAVYLLIPIGFAFAILKYRLLDIDVIIRKTVIYSGVTGIVLVLYLALAGASGLVLVRTAGLQGETATVAATLAVVALFVPIRNRVQTFVDRRFFQREQDLEAARARIGGLVSRAADQEEILLHIAEETQLALHSRSVAIFTRIDDELRLEASVGIPDEHRVPPTLHLESIEAAGTVRVVRLDDLNLSIDSDIRALKRVRAAILAVVRRNEETIAVISAGPKLNRESFDHEDEAFLETVSDYLALALGRAYQSRSQAELARAREIQRSLLPASLPKIDGVDVAARWKPAREVSGDYYDALRLDSSRLAVCIGDVVGKGMPAALLMSSLQAALKAVAHQTASPKDVCTQVRDVMLQSLAGGTFVTFFFAVIDREAGRIRYCNAGHNPPVLVRANGTLVRLDVGGPIFARIAADRPYQEASINLESGDRIVLFTDGVTEAEDDESEMFEDWRLEELLTENRDATAADLEKIIAEAVLDHALGKLQDDLTLVVVAID